MLPNPENSITSITKLLGVSLVNQYGVWAALDGSASRSFTPWLFAVGHLMFGMVLGLALAPSPAIAVRKARTA